MQPIPLKPDAGAVARAERRLLVRAITAMTLAGQSRRPPTSSSRPGMIPSPSVFSMRRSTARGLRTSRSCRRPVADRLFGQAGLSAIWLRPKPSENRRLTQQAAAARLLQLFGVQQPTNRFVLS
jgi:hypothetical protein